MTGAGQSAPEDRPVLLTDGTSAVLRPIRPEDAEALSALHRNLSTEARYFRYFSFRRGIGALELTRFTHPDGRLHGGFVALVSGELVGHACFDRGEGERDAEVAFEVADAHQRRGLGTLLVEALAEQARGAGVAAFTASVLPENRICLDVFRDLGLAETTRFEGGTVAVRIDLTPTAAYRAAGARRRARARARARRGPGGGSPCTSSSTTSSSTR